MFDAKKIGILLGLAAAAYLGALAVARFTLQTEEDTESEPQATKVIATDFGAPAKTGVNGPTARQKKEAQGDAENIGPRIDVFDQIPPQNNLALSPPDESPVEIAPGETPDGTALEGEIEVEKCWDQSGLEHPAGDCDDLGNLKAKISERLWAMNSCREEEVGESASGTLDLGMEVDFAGAGLSFWAMPTSEMRGAVETAACIKDKLKSLRPETNSRRFARYQYSMSVRFFDEQRSVESERIEVIATKAIDENKGMIVPVSRDRVRVRKQPVDGEILCKISSDSRVLLFDRQGDWCLIKTPRGTVGWMVCWGLGLDSDAGPKAP